MWFIRITSDPAQLSLCLSQPHGYMAAEEVNPLLSEISVKYPPTSSMNYVCKRPLKRAYLEQKILTFLRAGPPHYPYTQ